MTVIRAMLRASTPARLVLVLSGVSVAMVFAEPLIWRYEPLWGIWNYNGTLIITGPLAAGLVAWDSARSHGIARLAAARGTSLRFILSQVIPAAVALAISYVVGLLAVLLVLTSSGGTASLTRMDAGAWVSALPVLAYCLLVSCLGALLGWLMPRWYSAPLVAAGVYGLEVALFHGGLVGWVTVGGAAGSLVGLAPNPPRYLTQTLVFAALSALLVAVQVYLSRRSPRTGAAAAASAIFVVGALAIFAPNQSPVFRYGDTSQTCRSEGAVEYCVPTDYQVRLENVAQAIAPYDTALRDLGIQLPARYSAQLQSDQPAGPVPTSLLQGDDDTSIAMSAAISAATLGGCEDWSQEQFEAHLLVLQYLERSSTGSVVGMPVDGRVLSEDPGVVRQVVGGAIDLLKTPCRR